MPATIDRLIINSPYEEPTQHWSYHAETRNFVLKDGRRPAGYLVASERSRSYDDPGEFRQINLVNAIRPRIKAWREAGYLGVTGITRQLLEYWNDPSERDDRRFFFCQMEAIETLIWLTEAPESERVGITVPCDCHWRCKSAHFRRAKNAHLTTFKHKLEGSGNAENGGLSHDTRSLPPGDDHQSNLQGNGV